MSVLKTAVLRQIAYARSIRSIIRAIMRRMLDGEWINRIFASSDDEFNAKLDEALKSLDLLNATKHEFCTVVVDVLCGEVSDLCLALKDVCEGSGYSDYYESHISHEKFVRLVLSVDTVKRGKMKKIVENKSLTPIDVLREIGAILNDESLETRSALNASERRRANAELKAIAVDVKKTMQTGFKEVNANIKAGVAAVGEKVDAVAAKVTRGKHRCKYDDETVAFCVGVMAAAENNTTIKNSLNTRVTYSAVFNYNRKELAAHGVADVSEFTRIIRAHQAREQRVRDKELEAHKPPRPKRKQSVNEYAIISSGHGADTMADPKK